MPVIWEPTLVEELFDVEVVDVACGLDHSLILCSDGTLVSGGSNVYGQLGRVKEDLGLHQVDLSHRPMSIASGLGHSLAICKHTSSESEKIVEVSLHGDGTRVLNLEREGSENVPLVVDSLVGEMPISVSGGAGAFLSCDGQARGLELGLR
ncbi:UNVERIFIED_CONTAM: hypothetical protein Slati_3974400 [Sesamum latifolium]|uniref:Uncharacterized protein n=1 Tax=Sesamum latifolium TaxID=2727402 RepID=A0AAW2TQ80_9LAMI